MLFLLSVFYQVEICALVVRGRGKNVLHVLVDTGSAKWWAGPRNNKPISISVLLYGMF